MDKNLNLPPVIETMMEKLEQYVMLCKYLQLYMVEPSTVIDQLSNSEDGDLKTIFLNVKEGLKGDFTKSKAIDIGRQAIFSAIVKVKDELVSAYNDAKDVSKYPTIELYNAYDIAMNNTDIFTIMRRKEAYTANEVALEYLHSKLIKISEPMLREVDNVIDVKTYLYKLNVVLDMLVKNRDKSVFEKPIMHHKQVTDYSKVVLNNVSGDKYDIVENTPIPFDDMCGISDKELFVKLMQDIKVPMMIDKSVLELLNAAVDKLDLAITDIRTAIEQYGNNVTLINKVDTYFTKTISDFGENYILPYSESKVTTAEFDIAIANYSNFLETQAIDMSNSFAMVSYVAKDILTDLKLYTQCYAVLDMISFHGTVGRYTANVK